MNYEFDWNYIACGDCFLRRIYFLCPNLDADRKFCGVGRGCFFGGRNQIGDGGLAWLNLRFNKFRNDME